MRWSSPFSSARAASRGSSRPRFWPDACGGGPGGCAPRARATSAAGGAGGATAPGSGVGAAMWRAAAWATEGGKKPSHVFIKFCRDVRCFGPDAANAAPMSAGRLAAKRSLYGEPTFLQIESAR